MAAETVMWYYTDKEGKIHGPHGSQEMYQWFKLGYFPMDVMVKQERDPAFVTLGDMFKIYNNQLPFLATQATVPADRPPLQVISAGMVPIPMVTSGGGIPYPPPTASNPLTPCPPTPVPIFVGGPPVTMDSNGHITPVASAAFFAAPQAIYPSGHYPPQAPMGTGPYSISRSTTGNNSGASTPNASNGAIVLNNHNGTMDEMDGSEGHSGSRGQGAQYGRGNHRGCGGGGSRGLALGTSPMPNDMETSSPSPSPPAYPPAPDSDGCASETASTDGILRMVQAQRSLAAKGGFYMPEFAQSMSIMSVASEGRASDRSSLDVMEKHLEANRNWYDKQWMQIQQAKAKLPSKLDKQTETEKCLFVEPHCVDAETECRPSVKDKNVATTEAIRISASAIARILSEELGQKVVIVDE